MASVLDVSAWLLWNFKAFVSSRPSAVLLACSDWKAKFLFSGSNKLTFPSLSVFSKLIGSKNNEGLYFLIVS
ncbi:hypothetical protein [Mesomycoplasma ovipneumoniae]|uniref:hypothetical protein n=1 Tax=Mesomycoplasma ovipneumoniae TaxID=29562 RepID=UPI00311C8CC6